MPNPNFIQPLEDNDPKPNGRLPAAHDPGALRRRNLDNDMVSVVHSGESDPQPSREAHDAYADDADDETKEETGEGNRKNA